MQDVNTISRPVQNLSEYEQCREVRRSPGPSIVSLPSGYHNSSNRPVDGVTLVSVPSTRVSLRSRISGEVNPLHTYP